MASVKTPEISLVCGQASSYAVSIADYGLWKNPHLAKLLGALKIDCGLAFDGSCIRVGWGRKASGRRAEFLARINRVPFCLLEDGFLRSIEPGKHAPGFSLVLDSEGIYYDATGPSHLETLVHDGCTDPTRTQALMCMWRQARISKYNHLREYSGPLPENYVLLADQTFGDASIARGQADASTFSRMLEAALAENPECTILIKTHPEVLSGSKRGHFDLARLSENSRIRILAENAHPVRLIEHARAIYTVTSQIGFEGLLWNKRVRVFGMPFYAGWGLTDDAQTAPVRRGKASLDSLVEAALIKYARYIDPETGERCEIERLIEWVALQRQMRERFDTTLVAMDFSAWKKPIVERFFQGSQVSFADSGTPLPPDSTTLVWGMKQAPAGHQTLRIEDGFLRSVGLGADLIAPLSWVVDSRGIYYDATRPSDLEHILATTEFDDAIIARAKNLREQIVTANLTKYNVGHGNWQRPTGHSKVILVPGQVESDASLAYGAPGIRKNIDLLRAVRTSNPDAYIVYKPHPDVIAGLRARGENENVVEQFCNEVVIDQPMALMLNLVDEVHVLTSLAGFEALLRGKRVVAYGQPFYAGWGLTHDILPLGRRKRILSVDELVAGTLISYPTYVSRENGAFTIPERALYELTIWRGQRKTSPSLWHRVKRVALRLHNHKR